jgi:hypothetical protein
MATKSNDRTGLNRHPFSDTGVHPWRYLNVHISKMPKPVPMVDFERLAETEGVSPTFIGYIRSHEGDFLGDDGIAWTGNYRGLNGFLTKALFERIDGIREIIVKKSFLVKADKTIKGGHMPTSKYSESLYCHLVIGPVKGENLQPDTSYVQKGDKYYKVVELKGFNIVDVNDNSYGLPKPCEHPDAPKIRKWVQGLYAAHAAKMAKAKAKAADVDTTEDNPL